MNKKMGLLTLILAITGLTGCGLKGPLYFPQKEKPLPPATTHQIISPDDANQMPKNNQPGIK
ncbi:lipoprotein [Enterobacteriaceae bacterium LUAb1]